MVLFPPTQPDPVDLDRLRTTLNLSGIQQSNNPLYQVIDQILSAVQSFQRSASININNSSGDITALKNVDYLTITNQQAFLPNSRPTGLTNYTSGAVLFSGGASLINQDQTVFFWDATNNRLGVGTDAPLTDIHLLHNAIGALPFTATSTNSIIGQKYQNATAATLAIPVQAPPSFEWSGTAWDTNDSVSRIVRATIYHVPVSGTSPVSYLAFRQDEGAGWSVNDEIRIGQVLVGDAPSMRFRDGNILFRNSSRGIYFTANALTDATPGSHFIAASTTGRIDLTPLTGGSEGYVNIEQNEFGVATGTIPSLNIRSFDNSTNSPQPGLRQRAVPGGAVANGFGSRTWFQASSSTTSNQDQSAIDSVWNDVTHASRSADLSFLLVHGAAALAEKLRIRSRGLLDVTAGYIQWVGQKRVTAQFDKTNDAALANITGLSVNVEAARNYYFEAHLFVDADVVGGHQYAIAGTATATSIKYQIDSIDNTLSVYVITSREVALAGAAGQSGATVVETIIKGQIVVNAAGTLTVQFAQNAATPATTSSVLTNSYFIVQEMA